MPRVNLETQDRIRLPSQLRRRCGLEPGDELLLEETEAGLTLHPLQPNARKLYLEITTRCNLQCCTCVRNVWAEPTQDMGKATFERVLAGLRDMPNLREVVFGGYGEPFAHPHVFDYLAAVKDMELKVTISTNGTLFDQEQIERLVRLGVDVVNFSLDGTDPDTYADVRQGADLRTVLDNIELLNRIKAQWGTSFPRVGIEFVALERNVAELSRLPDLARRVRANRVILTHVLPHTPQMAAETLYYRDHTPVWPLSTGWPIQSDGWLLWGTLERPRMNWGAERHCRFVASNAVVVG